MLKTPTSTRPSWTTRCVPGGNSSTGPTTYSAIQDPIRHHLLPRHPVLQLARGRRDAEQLQRVLTHDLALGFARHGQLHDRARVVEVVVRPIGSEDDPL